MYQSPFFWLNEAATLIAHRLACTGPARYADEASAIEDARRQLIRALFDGAVYSEGVPLEGDPGPEDPDLPPSAPEPQTWTPIAAGWWSHERYEQYVYRHQQTELELLLFRPELASNKEPPRPELIEQIVKESYLLDKIIVSWNTNSFSVEGFEGDCGYVRIRVRRADIEANFNIATAEIKLPPTTQRTAVATLSSMARLTKTGIAQKRKTKPDRVRTEVNGWLDERLKEKGRDSCVRQVQQIGHGWGALVH